MLSKWHDCDLPITAIYLNFIGGKNAVYWYFTGIKLSERGKWTKDWILKYQQKSVQEKI